MADIHYIDKPEAKNGVSDPVVVQTTDHQVCVAWYDSRDKWWHSEDGQTFGNVEKWAKLPKEFIWSDDIYGGEV